MVGKGTAVGSIVVGATLLALPYEANALRCHNRLVSRHNSRSRVLAICGQPEDVSSYVIYRRSAHFRTDVYRRRGPYVVRHGIRGPEVEVPVQVEEWIYNFGRNRLMQRVVFNNGRVERIESLGYGYDDLAPLPLADRRSRSTPTYRADPRQGTERDASAPPPQQRAVSAPPPQQRDTSTPVPQQRDTSTPRPQ
jgi:hypothetical protein